MTPREAGGVKSADRSNAEARRAWQAPVLAEVEFGYTASGQGGARTA